MKKKILLGLTTTPRSDWRGKVEEIKKFKIKEVALFPTMLAIKERKELYKLLEKTGLEKIPHVHLRDDTESWELDYFTKKYKTRLFNVHLSSEPNNLTEGSRKYLNKIFIENNFVIGKEFIGALKKFAGICFDIAHYHDLGIIQQLPAYRNFSALLKKYAIGCCHISAIRKEPVFYNSWDIKSSEVDKLFSCHLLEQLSELDYVKNYTSYLPEYVSIELENSFEEQLEVKKYLEKIIK